MKKAIKIVTVLGVQLILVAAFAVAGGDSEGTTGSATEQPEISVVFKPYSVGWGDCTEKMNIWATSGELPDVMGAVDAVGTGTYFRWIEDGVIRARPDDLGG